MAKPDTWMPFYVGDYLSDTMHLTRDEHGAYLLLIMAYWKRGGPLPDDPVSLAAIARATMDEWLGMGSTPVERALNIRCRQFFTVAGGCWRHKRIDEELEKANRNIEQKRRAGLASANARSTHVEQPFNGRTNGTSTENQHTDGEGEGNGNGDLTEGVQGEGPVTARTIPPPIEAVIAHGVRIMLPEDQCRLFFDHHDARGWKAKGSKIVNWQRAMSTWASNYRSGVYAPKNGHTKPIRDNIFAKGSTNDPS